MRGGRRPLNSVLSPVFMIIDYLIDTASLTNIFICKSHPALFLWHQISISLWPQVANPVLFQFAPVPGIISGLPQGLAPYLSPQVDFRMVMVMVMVISRTLRTITLLARKRVKRTLKKRKIFAHLHTCNHLTADLNKILYSLCSILVSLLEPSIIW